MKWGTPGFWIQIWKWVLFMVYFVYPLLYFFSGGGILLYVFKILILVLFVNESFTMNIVPHCVKNVRSQQKRKYVTVWELWINIRDAVDSPRFHHQWLPDLLQVEKALLSRNKIKKLSELGYDIKIVSDFGRVEAIVFNQDGTLSGHSDIRGNGMAVGYWLNGDLPAVYLFKNKFIIEIIKTREWICGFLSCW